MSENHIRPWRNIYRRKSRQINVGGVPIGGDAPIAVQTMTNTLTTDIKSTIEQVTAAAEAGADIVRVSVPDIESSKALKEIVQESPVPIVADIHFHYKRGIEAAEAGAALVHIHARDPETGRPDQSPEAFAPILQVVKQATDAVVNITTGGAPTMTVQERVRPAEQFRPEVASLNMGSMNFGLYPMLSRFSEIQT